MTNFGIGMSGVAERKITDNSALRHPRCRLCNAPLITTFVDLGMSPLCENILTADQIDQMEPFFPLHVLVCGDCYLVQLREYVKPESIFTEYDYFSSYSVSWVEHARRYCEMIKAKLNLDKNSQVYEIASNDGYLLQHFLPLGIPVTGVEPAANVAAAARKKIFRQLLNFSGWTWRDDSSRRETRRPHHWQQCACTGARPQ
jgi:hypothetical protein